MPTKASCGSGYLQQAALAEQVWNLEPMPYTHCVLLAKSPSLFGFSFSHLLRKVAGYGVIWEAKAGRP